MNNDDEIIDLLAQAKSLGQRYRVLTGKPLGITGEVAEYEAARLLGLHLVEARQAGYDAIRIKNGTKEYIQIKGRVLLPTSRSGQRIGKIDITKKFDYVLMVLMDEHFDTTAIYEADRKAVIEALTKPGSIARNERGALSVSKFRSIGQQIW